MTEFWTHAYIGMVNTIYMCGDRVCADVVGWFSHVQQWQSVCLSYPAYKRWVTGIGVAK